MPHLIAQKEKESESKITKEDLHLIKGYNDFMQRIRKEDLLIKQKRREEDFLIKQKRREEDFLLKQVISQRRKKEDFLLKQKRREEDFLKSKKFAPLNVLKKQIRMSNTIKDSSMKKREEVITLNEESDEEQGISNKTIENGMKKEEN